MKKTVLVIFGGNSTEHDISIITGVEALNAMPVKGFKVIPIYIREGVWYTGSELYEIKNYINFFAGGLKAVKLVGKELYSVGRRGKFEKEADVDCALLATHGGDGENGTIQGFLEMNGVPHTSAGVRECAVCMDKILTKLALREIGVRVVEGREVIYPAPDDDIYLLEEIFGYPMIVKPSSQGSSIGITMAKNRSELEFGLKLASCFGERVLVERGLKDIVEINSAAIAIGGEIKLSEIEKPLTASDFLTYSDKYMGSAKGMAGGMREFPAKVPEAVREEILRTTEKVYAALNLSGVVRIDYLVQDDLVYLNEINTIPGSLSHYLFPGLAYPDLLKALVESGIDRGVPKSPKFISKVLSNIGAKHK
jgi:D-alanine-D-alanine ligase and related ATP-grasp enzymes